MSTAKFRQLFKTIAKFSGRLSLAGAHLLVAVVVAWLVLRFFPGDRWTPARLGSYFAPWLFMALFPALAIALLAQRRRLAQWVALLILGFAASYWPLLAPRQTTVYAYASSSRLKVITFNVNLNNRDASGIAGFVQSEQPDIIAFQEMTDALSPALQAELQATHPYYLVDKSWGLPMVVASRYPLTALPKPAGAERAQHVLADTPAGQVVIWNVHPNPAVLSGWESQRSLLAAVAGDVAGEERPVLVLGDFNATAHTENYRLIADHLTDTHWAAGQGFGFTFPDFAKARIDYQHLPWQYKILLATQPAVKIDHIFASRHFTPLKSYVIQHAYGSDHRPVVAEMLVAR